MAADPVTLVLTLLCDLRAPQTFVAPFGLDERTAAASLAVAPGARQHVHEHCVQQGQGASQQMQPYELRVKLVRQRVWLALAVPSRLRPGGALSPHLELITGLCSAESWQ